MACTVEDCALLMNAAAGYDPKDPATRKLPVPDYTEALTGDVRGLRVGVPEEFFTIPLDPEVERAVRRAIEVLAGLGAEVIDVSWPMYRYAAPIATTIQLSEATAYHSDLVRRRGSEYAPAVRLLLETGFFISASDLNRAQQARTMFVRETLDLFQEVDILAGPMTPITAHPLGAAEVNVGGVMMTPRAALTQYTRPYNLSGFPALSVPCGFSEEGLPVGLQLAARPFAEETVLRAGHAYEQATEWCQRRPPL
jgi:aspartyl-tRNA(Asn)/glutamyl-tRNA(Gln) amidotransferase subunit A